MQELLEILVATEWLCSHDCKASGTHCFSQVCPPWGCYRLTGFYSHPLNCLWNANVPCSHTRCHPLSVSVQGLIMPIKCQDSLNRCADCFCRMIYWSNTLVRGRQERTLCPLVIPILVISVHIWASLARINFFSLKAKWESCYLGAS